MRFHRVVLMISGFVSLTLVAGVARSPGADGQKEEAAAKPAGAAADDAAQAADRKKRLRQQAADRVAKVKVARAEKLDRTGELVTNPLMSYTDEPLSIDAATLWAWGFKKAGRPVAVCKVEHYDKTRRAVPAEWLYCFASLSDERIRGDWPDGHQWTASRAGVAFRDIPDAPAPGATPAARLRQMKDVSRRFTATFEFDTARSHEELRLLPQPVYSYADAEAGIVDGAIFVSAMNGTNPTALFLVELQKDGDATKWKFAVGAMTDGGVIVKFDGREVWSKPALHAPGKDFETWTYFFEQTTE
jgi:hypothetical protein